MILTKNLALSASKHSTNEKLTVVGNISATGNVNAVNGDLTGTLHAAGATTLDSTLAVTGASTLTGAVSAKSTLTADGATTLIYQLGIGSYLRALIDDDPYHQNLESPGFGIPTVSPDKIFVDPPTVNHCLILAPQYVKQIVDKNAAARGSGVVFAKVWPQIQVISE